MIPPLARLGKRVAPPRFLLFLLAFLLATAGLIPQVGLSKAILIGFDIAALLFMASSVGLLKPHAPENIRQHAADNDANRPMLLVVTAATMAAILAAVGGELQTAVTLSSKALVIGTLALAWLFSNSVYALHYAHLYYRSGTDGGLTFSGSNPPDYGDFVYFAFTLGMTFQTSDTAVTTSAMRRAVTIHCVAAFIFNFGVIAFTISALGSG